MRKHGRLFIFALLLLLTPSLASAWTLYVKVQGNSSDGTVTIVDSAVPPVTTTLVGGQKYVQLTGAATATVVLSDGIAADVKLDYVDALPVDGPYALTSANSSLVVSMGQAATAQGDVTVVKSTGGNTLVTYLGKNTMTGFTNLKFGTTVGVKANPRSDYKVASITITDVALGLGTRYAQTTGAGVAVTKALTIASTDYTVSATYELVANAKAVLSAPLKAVVGQSVTLNAAGSTSNDADATYAFSVDGVEKQNTISMSYTFTPAAVNTALVVALDVKKGATILASKTASINVVSASTANNTLCLGCHTGSTPAIVSAYLNGGLINTPCTYCHTEAAHVNKLDAPGFDHSNGDVLVVTNANGTPTVAGCTVCHEEQGADWLTSEHRNPLASPSFRGETSCTPCHTTGESMVADPASILNGVPVMSAIISCNGCHSNNMTSVATSGAATACFTCHEPEYHDNYASNVGPIVQASKHNKLGHNDEIRCARCHTYEGSVEFAAYTGDKTEMDTLSDGEYLNGKNGPTCAACHDPHSGGMRDVAGWAPSTNAQFNLCTSCHTYFNDDGMIVAGGGTVDTTAELGVNLADISAPFYHNTSWYRTIGTTHYDRPETAAGTGGTTTSPIEGYVLRINGENPCFDCHGHELRTNTRYAGAPVAGDVDKETTIYTDWAKSAHAGGLLNAKLAAAADAAVASIANEPSRTDAVLNAAVTDAPIGNAWAHYDWDSASRSACQHCHTSTGAANFMDAAKEEVAYVAANNDFSHVQAGQNEMLYCWGCHSSPELGTLRLAGAFTVDYNVNGAAKAITAPDGNSAACLTCHSGRGNLNTLLGAATLDPTSTTVPSSPGTKTHYLAAGSTINQTELNLPYTYNLNYADPSYYAHKTIGCADCHMSGTNSHSFGVVNKDATTGEITSIAATNCVTCHSGAHGAALVGASQLGTTVTLAAGPTVVTQAMVDAAGAFLEEEALGFHGGLEVLAEELTAAGIVPGAAYPYFTGTPANQGQAGAMYIYSFLHHEPGAYAHNRVMAKRQVWDAIDWMDDGALNNSTVDTIAGNAHAAAWLGAVRP